MSKILISYRREDSQDVTGRIYDRLVQHFGREAVFKDVDSIPFGVDFRAYLEEQVAKCDVFLAVIGRNWIRAGRKGKSRLEDPEDFVRIEIEAALRRQIPVIPVLVAGAKVLSAERLPVSIRALAYRHALIVRPDPDFHRDIDRLIESFGSIPKSNQTASSPQSTPALKEQRLNVSPVPVGMVKVPRGPFLYGDEKTRVVIGHDYWIAKYPVTNEQYRVFISAGGYNNQAFWSVEGWEWKKERNVIDPEYWNDARWNKSDYPVVGVSYYEAEAYARWAGKRLPTEQEWEKAARGEDGRQYPWGEEFDTSRCNSRETVNGQTTSVTQYPKGVSPYGCYDMAGNVWEWCVDWYDEEGGERVIRGGSWYYRPVHLRSSYRIRYFAGHRNFNIGFRLVQDVDE